MSNPAITLLPCGQKYRHTRGAWSSEYPLSDLPKWIKFYRKLADKRAKFYGPDYAALRLFEKELTDVSTTQSTYR